MGIHNTETNGSLYENKWEFFFMETKWKQWEFMWKQWEFIWKQNGVDRPHLYMEDFLLKQKPKDLMSSSSKSQLISELKKFQQLRLQLLKIDIGLCRKKWQLKKCVDPSKKGVIFCCSKRKKDIQFHLPFCHYFCGGGPKKY